MIEAIRVEDLLRQPGIPMWAVEALLSEQILISAECVSIVTLEGVMSCGPGDWIIRGIKGELYPCRGDIFAETYEPARVSTFGPFGSHT